MKNDFTPAPSLILTDLRLPGKPGNAVLELAPDVPVMTIDADFLAEDRDLRVTYLGTDNYLMGVKMAEEAARLKPEGGTVCLQLGNVTQGGGIRVTGGGAGVGPVRMAVNDHTTGTTDTFSTVMVKSHRLFTFIDKLLI